MHTKVSQRRSTANDKKKSHKSSVRGGKQASHLASTDAVPASLLTTPPAVPGSSVVLASPAPAASVGEEKDAVLEELVRQLQAVARAATVELAYQVGELVVRSLFGGDVSLVHRRGPKSQAFTRLAQHPGLPFSASVLSRSIRIYELLTRLPELRSVEQLGLNHFRAVLSLPPDRQESLLRQAAEEGWSGEQLAKEGEGQKAEAGAKRGRKPMPPELRSLGQFRRRLDSASPTRDFSFVDQLTETQMEEVQQILQQVRGWCDELAICVRKRSGTVETCP